METTIIIVLVLVGVAAFAFYGGHLKGVAATLKKVHEDIATQASAHASLIDELVAARNQVRTLLRPSKATTEHVETAAAAVAAAAPPAPDPRDAARAELKRQRALLDAQLEALG